MTDTTITEQDGSLTGIPSIDYRRLCDPGALNIAVKLRRWLTTQERTEHIRPLLPILIKSNSDDTGVLIRRACICADYAVREFAPFELDALGFRDEAQTLRALPKILDRKSARAAEYAVSAVHCAVAEVNLAVYGLLSEGSAVMHASSSAMYAHFAHGSQQYAAEYAAPAAERACASAVYAAESCGPLRLELITLACQLIRDICAVTSPRS